MQRSLEIGESAPCCSARSIACLLSVAGAFGRPMSLDGLAVEAPARPGCHGSSSPFVPSAGSITVAMATIPAGGEGRHRQSG
jgi:hypothetical protein